MNLLITWLLADGQQAHVITLHYPPPGGTFVHNATQGNAATNNSPKRGTNATLALHSMITMPQMA